MRKVIVLEHISLDGVIQGPGGPDEDTSGGFAHGGWARRGPDELLDKRLSEMMNAPFDLLLGRKTYEIWEAYWPQHVEVWPNADKAVKYVASTTRTSGKWHHTEILSGAIVEQVRAIKQTPGPDLHIWGSANLVQTLMRHDLVDVLWLMIYPLTLGTGKRLFAEGTMPLEFFLTEVTTTSKGVLVVRYERQAGVK